MIICKQLQLAAGAVGLPLNSMGLLSAFIPWEPLLHLPYVIVNEASGESE